MTTTTSNDNVSIWPQHVIEAHINYYLTDLAILSNALVELKNLSDKSQRMTFMHVRVHSLMVAECFKLTQLPQVPADRFKDVLNVLQMPLDNLEKQDFDPASDICNVYSDIEEVKRKGIDSMFEFFGNQQNLLRYREAEKKRRARVQMLAADMVVLNRVNFDGLSIPASTSIVNELAHAKSLVEKKLRTLVHVADKEAWDDNAFAEFSNAF